MEESTKSALKARLFCFIIIGVPCIVFAIEDFLAERDEGIRVDLLFIFIICSCFGTTEALRLYNPSMSIEDDMYAGVIVMHGGVAIFYALVVVISVCGVTCDGAPSVSRPLVFTLFGVYHLIPELFWAAAAFCLGAPFAIVGGMIWAVYMGIDLGIDLAINCATSKPSPKVIPNNFSITTPRRSFDLGSSSLPPSVSCV